MRQALNWMRRRRRTVFISFIVLAATATLAIYNKESHAQFSKIYPRLSQPDLKEGVEDEKAKEPFRDLVGLSEKDSYLRTSATTCRMDMIREKFGDVDTIDLYAEQHGAPSLKRTSRTQNGKKLKVFVLPFTHVDPGWLKTFDGYSTDTNKILDNMHAFMMKNPRMRFMWAEFVFFERWFSARNESVQDDVRSLVSSGRLELASGSWVMTDEANAYFPVSVDNIIEGHQWIAKEFKGFRPDVMWSNDPFGYGNTVPYLFQKAGVSNLVINRIHHGIKGRLQALRAIPFEWMQYWAEKNDRGVLTHVLPYTHYDHQNACGSSPEVCCRFDFRRVTQTNWRCPMNQPVYVDEGNVKQLASELVLSLKQMAAIYESEVITMPHGDDFRYDGMEEWHQQHDNLVKIFDEINKGGELEIEFGTFSQYFKALRKSLPKPVKLTGDFFPYMCAMGDYWTGYFTTRPFFKLQGRKLHSLIRSTDLLISLSGKRSPETDAVMSSARRTLSLFQHHDAITGTSRNSVMMDYSQLLFDASEAVSKVAETVMGGGHMVESQRNRTEIVTHRDHKVDRDMTLSIFNPLPYHSEEVISVRVTSPSVAVYTAEGSLVSSQIEPAIYDGVVSKGSYMLVFKHTLPALSTVRLRVRAEEGKTKVVKVQYVGEVEQQLASIFSPTRGINGFTLQNDMITAKFNKTSGLLQDVEFAQKKRRINMSFGKYSTRGGAYVMIDDAEEALPNNASLVLSFSGPIQSSIVSWMDKVVHTTTLKHISGSPARHLHFTTHVDIRNWSNEQLVFRLSTDLSTSSFYTDGNGLQMLRRHSFDGKTKVAERYYPMPTAAYVDEKKKGRVTVIGDVEHGASQHVKGGLEVMIDRQIAQDDGKGLGSSDDGVPRDTLPVEMRHVLVVEHDDSKPVNNSHFGLLTQSANRARQSLLYRPVVVASQDPAPLSPPTTAPAPFACGYQLLTVRHMTEKTVLVIIHRSGEYCNANESIDMCGDHALDNSLHALFSSLGCVSVSVADLAGFSSGRKQECAAFQPPLVNPMDFLSLIVHV